MRRILVDVVVIRVLMCIWNVILMEYQIALAVERSYTLDQLGFISGLCDRLQGINIVISDETLKVRALFLFVFGSLLLIGCQAGAAGYPQALVTPSPQTSKFVPEITSESTTISASISSTAVVPTRSVAENTQANDSSGDPTGLPPSISFDGRWIVFTSRASNLVPDDTNGCWSNWHYEASGGNCLDVFVYDQVSGKIKRVSAGSDGTEANGESFTPVISADGHVVAFRSRADNLTPSFREVCAQHYFPDKCSGIYVHDLETGQTDLVAVRKDNGGIGGSYYLSISADGHLTAFWSYESISANTLPLGDDSLFAYDRLIQQGLTVLEGQKGYLQGANCQPFSISTDQPWQAFSCPFGGIFAYRSPTKTVEIVSASDSNLSADGRYIAFASETSDLIPDDTNECSNPQFGAHNCSDVFVYDAQTSLIERVSVSSEGAQSNGESYNPSISADGRFVVFASDATNLVPGDTNACRPNRFVSSCFDVFVHDRQTRTTSRVSLASDGTQANGDSRWPRISGDGQWIVFVSRADNLVPNDTNDFPDVFMYNRPSGKTELISAPNSN